MATRLQRLSILQFWVKTEQTYRQFYSVLEVSQLPPVIWTLVIAYPGVKRYGSKWFLKKEADRTLSHSPLVFKIVVVANYAPN